MVTTWVEMQVWEGRAAGSDTAGQRDTPCPRALTGDMDLVSKLRHPQCSAPATQQKAVLCHQGCLPAVSKPHPVSLCSLGPGGKKLWRGMEIRAQSWWGR